MKKITLLFQMNLLLFACCSLSTNEIHQKIIYVRYMPDKPGILYKMTLSSSKKHSQIYVEIYRAEARIRIIAEKNQQFYDTFLRQKIDYYKGAERRQGKEFRRFNEAWMTRREWIKENFLYYSGKFPRSEFKVLWNSILAYDKNDFHKSVTEMYGVGLSSAGPTQLYSIEVTENTENIVKNIQVLKFHQDMIYWPSPYWQEGMVKRISEKTPGYVELFCLFDMYIQPENIKELKTIPVLEKHIIESMNELERLNDNKNFGELAEVIRDIRNGWDWNKAIQGELQARPQISKQE